MLAHLLRDHFISLHFTRYPSLLPAVRHPAEPRLDSSETVRSNTILTLDQTAGTPGMGILRCLVLLSLSCLAACQTKSSSVVPQPFQSLPPPPTYTEGGFKNPNTATGGYIYSQGTSMNISWWTIHPTVNLFLIYGQDYGNPTWLASEYTHKV